MQGMSWTIARHVAGAAALALLSQATLAAPASLLTPEAVLQKIEGSQDRGPEARPGLTAPAQLLADIKAYRLEVGRLDPAVASSRWFALFDRAGQVGDAAGTMDFAAYDLETLKVVGIDSVLASLPPPTAWPAMRKEASVRADRAGAGRDALALRYLMEVLGGDREAARKSLDALERIFAALPPEERLSSSMLVSNARSRLVKLYGGADEIALAFESDLVRADNPYDTSIRVPDLVGLVGEAAARKALERAVVSAKSLEIDAGDETRRLASEIALARIGGMQVPQWSLVNHIGAARLFEAIESRFDPAAARLAEAGAPGSAEELSGGIGSELRGYAKRRASGWYFLASVIERKQREAERALAILSGEGEVHVPKDAVDALREAGHGDALHSFLGAQLERRPELRAWDLYIEQAAASGRAGESLALIEKLLARKDLPEFVSADLRARRVAALLAADKVDVAAREYKSLLAKPPVRGEVTLETRFDAALAAAEVGRLTRRKDLEEAGLSFATNAANLLPRNDREFALPERHRSLWRQLRRSGRAAEVQSLAIAELERTGARSGLQTLSAFVAPVEIAALVELASIWSAAGRHADVLALANESTRWATQDAGAILAYSDSANLPFGAILGRALRDSGDRDRAQRVARATVSQLPGHDAAYELLSEVDPHAVATFDAVFALDSYEERPLIWKAAVQLRAGAVEEAETTIRRAISIDPSDGEQGVNDRMRAYAVLSELLARKGDAAGAETYAKAVKSIRMSEEADALHAAGLYARAFSAYRAALDQFSDAYCIQSRLAVQLHKQGRRAEALEHYRRAYELMPDSFGRVESHCFGCENVFQGADAQSLAEKVFTDTLRRTPGKAQAHYLLAYLREQQGRPKDALEPLRQAVRIDPQYLNAWKHLDDIGEHVYVEPWEADIARLKLLELDPLQRHVRYELAEVGDLPALWRGVERAGATIDSAKPIRSDVYPLKASAAALAKAREAMPAEMLEQMDVIQQFSELGPEVANGVRTPAGVLRQHVLVESFRSLVGIDDSPGY